MAKNLFEILFSRDCRTSLERPENCIKNPWLGHITPDIKKKKFNYRFNFQLAFKVFKYAAPNTFQFSLSLELE